MAQAFSCMSHYPLKLLPFLLIVYQLNLSALTYLILIGYYQAFYADQKLLQLQEFINHCRKYWLIEQAKEPRAKRALNIGFTFVRLPEQTTPKSC